MNHRQGRFLFPAVAALLMFPVVAPAQEPKGWIEGSVLNKSGKIVWVLARQSNIVPLRVVGPSKAQTNPDYSTGNFYTLRDLKPGVYEVFVGATRDDDAQYRPQHIMGLVVKPNVRTLLNIVVHEGNEVIEEVGKPVPTETGMTLAEMVDRLTHELDLLKRQVSELKK